MRKRRRPSAANRWGDLPERREIAVLDTLVNGWMPVSKIMSKVAKRGEFDWLPLSGVRKAVNAAAYRLEHRGLVKCRLIIDDRSHAVLEVRRR
jgi:hypothetical protein